MMHSVRSRPVSLEMSVINKCVVTELWPNEMRLMKRRVPVFIPSATFSLLADHWRRKKKLFLKPEYSDGSLFMTEVLSFP